MVAHMHAAAARLTNDWCFLISAQRIYFSLDMHAWAYVTLSRQERLYMSSSCESCIFPQLTKERNQKQWGKS